MIGDGGIGAPLEVDSWRPPAPDALDLVLETETMLAVFAAQRYLRIDAMRMETLAAAPVSPGFENVAERSLRLELAAALGVTESTAGRYMAHAEALVHRYPAALDALLGGRTTQRHVDELADLLDAVEPEVATVLLSDAVALAEAEAFGVFRRKLRSLIDTARADTLQERFEQAVPGRRVILTDEPDGMAFLGGLMPAVDAHAAFNRMTTMGKILSGREGETRTLDQIRADLMGDLLIEGEPDSSPDGVHGIQATVFVTVPALTLLDSELESELENEGEAEAGVTAGESDATDDATDSELADESDDATDSEPADESDDESENEAVAETTLESESDNEAASDSASTDRGSRAVARHGPATMEGVGPIPLSRAKELIGGAAGWTRVLTHPETGMVLSVGRDRYRPPPGLRRLARWRAETCMAPGCSMPATRCELDHRVPWQEGGTTSLENIAPICKGHHIIKHHGGWTITELPDSGGVLEWTSPAGRVYLVEPERRVPTFTPDPIATTPGPIAAETPPF